MPAGSQSFNRVNTLRVLGRWMRMITLPNPGVPLDAATDLSRIAAAKQT